METGWEKMNALIRRQKLAEQGRCGYLWMGVDSKRIIASKAIYPMLELDPFSLFFTEKTFQGFVHPADLAEYIRVREEVIRIHQSAVSIFRVITARGNERHFSEVTQYVESPSENTIVSIIRDETQQDETYQILDVLKEAYFELDNQLAFRRVNREAETYWQKQKQDLLGHRIWDVFPDLLNTPFYASVLRAVKENIRIVENFIFPSSREWVHASISPHEYGVVVIFFDIQKEKEHEHQLLNRESRWKALVENTPDIITRWNRRQQLIYANSSFDADARALARLLFKTDPEHGSAEELNEAWSAKLGEVLQTGNQTSHYNFVSTPEGDVYYFTQMVPEVDENGLVRTVLAISRDVTDLKTKQLAISEMNESLKKKNHLLEQHNKELASLGLVTSRDLKEPLKRIYTSVELLISAEAAKLTDAGRAHFRRIQSAVQKMGLITDDLLSFVSLASTEVAQEMGLVDLNQILQHCLGELQKQIADSQAQLTIDELPAVWGNRQLLIQLFEHLLKNAIRFRKPGKRPQVRVAAEIVMKMDDDRQIALKEWNKISVIDNGIGFDEKEKHLLFQLFSILPGHQKAGGSGIGLATSRKIMELHHGSIHAGSDGQTGSVFYCCFPLQNERVLRDESRERKESTGSKDDEGDHAHQVKTPI